MTIGPICPIKVRLSPARSSSTGHPGQANSDGQYEKNSQLSPEQYENVPVDPEAENFLLDGFVFELFDADIGGIDAWVGYASDGGESRSAQTAHRNSPPGGEPRLWFLDITATSRSPL